MAAGDEPDAIAVNPVTKKVYLANRDGDDVTVIDGSDLTTITVPAGDFPMALALNPVSNRVYVANRDGDDVTVITPNSIQAIRSSPLTTAIAPLLGDTTRTAITNFGFTAARLNTPMAPPVQQVYYQVDTQTGPWLRANLDGGIAIGDTPPLQPGVHLLFALAADGQEATSTNNGTGSSSIPGQVSAYLLLTKTDLPVLTGDEWRYFKGTAEPPPDWKLGTLDDSF